MSEIDAHTLQRQPQVDTTWYLSVRLGHPRLEPSGSSLRNTHILLLLDEQGKPLSHSVQEHTFSRGQVWRLLVNAICGTDHAAGLRPRRLHFDQPELLAGLASHLETAGIQGFYQAHMPEIERALVELERGFSPAVLLPPALATIPHATPELLGRIYGYTASFYRLAPWQIVPGEAPLEVRYPADGAARWIVVIGSGGDTFGLSISDSRADLERMYAGGDPLELARSICWLALTFDTAEYLAIEDLDAIQRQSWPVVNENAFPALYRVGGPQADIQAPTLEDLLWLDGVLPALLQYFGERTAADSRWRTPHESRVKVSTPSGAVEVLVHFPGLEST